MGSSELELSYKDWARRVSQYEQMGIPSSVYGPIASNDMRKTYSEDAEPMTDLEANVAVAAAATGTPPITESPRHSSDPLATIASNIVPDVQNLITSLPRGIYDTVRQVASPSSWKDLAEVAFGSNSSPEFQKVAAESGVNPQAYDPNRFSDMGATFRLFAHTPILDLLPGISDFSNLTTGAGRQSLEEHPVSSVLDLAGLAGGGVGRAAGVEALARTGELGDTLSSLYEGVDMSDPAAVEKAEKALPAKLKESPTAASALARGHLVEAVGRAADRGLLARLVGGVSGELTEDAIRPTETGIRAAGEGLGPGQRLLREQAKKVHLDAADRALSTAMSRMSGKVALRGWRADRALRDLMGKDLVKDPDRLAAFHEKMTLHPQDEWPSIMDPHELSVAHSIRDEIRPALEAQYGDQILKTPEGTFPVKSQAAVNYRRMALASTREAAQRGRIDFAEQASENAQREAADTTDLDVKSAPRLAAIRTAAQPLLDELRVGQNTLLSDSQVTTALGRKIDSQMGELVGGQLGTGRVARFQRALDAYVASGREDDLLRTRSALNRIDQILNSKTLARLPALDEVRRSVAQLRSELYGIRSKLSLDAKAVRSVERVKAERAKHETLKAKMTAHRDAYYRALHTTDIPANLHPMLAEALRSHVEEASKGEIEARTSAGVNPLAKVSMDRIAQAHTLSEIQDGMANVRNEGQEAALRSYLGKDEYEKLKTDSIDYLLQLNRDGRAPLFFHSVHADGEYHALSTKIKPLDSAPSSLLRHSFNLTTTLQTPFVGLLAEDINLGALEGTRQVINQALMPFDKTHDQIKQTYIKAAKRRIDSGRVKHTTVDQEAQALQRREWVRWNPKTGAEIPGTAHIRDTDHWIPRSMYENFTSFTRGGRIENALAGSRIYRGSMKVFRTSVLYGPRHFAHVVVGGAMPVLMAHPTAFRELPKVWPMMRSMLHGEVPTSDLIPDELLRPFDWKTEEGLQREVGRRVGHKYGTLLRQYIEKLPNPSEGFTRVEDTAQMMYQAITYLDEIRGGRDPMEALEAARKTVVNMDSASPFERTIMKQVMPFYSFSRFATLFLLQLPFDHPVRVSFLASMANQAQEEWGSGLPQDMMDLLFIGPESNTGEQATVNLKNVNPFRSVANMFTIGGFFSALNPSIQALGATMGIDTLSGTSEMYPEISYNAQTGDLQSVRPAGDMWTAIESFVPEFSAVDARFGLSDNYRYLYQNDRSAFWREMASDFNLPFTPSDYDIPEVRGNTALNLYKGAEQAAYNAKSSGNFGGDISRYNLVPADLTGVRTDLYTPEQIASYWKNLEAEYKKEYPGVNPAALIPKA